MGCREEVLAAARSLGTRSADGSFTPDDVIREMRRRGSRYLESTIRTYVVSVMCADAPVHHQNHTNDLERVDRGRYRLRQRPLPGAGRISLRNSISQPPPSSVVEAAQVLVEPPAGDSEVQRQAEGVALNILGRELDVTFVPERLTLAGGSRVEIDGVCNDPPILVEVWAHQGPPKPAQRNKVLADALKLAYVRDTLENHYRTVLCFTDESAVAPFRGTSWGSAALTHFGLETHVVDVGAEWRRRIRDAQTRQYR
jgi:hypothetical protein